METQNEATEAPTEVHFLCIITRNRKKMKRKSVGASF